MSHEFAEPILTEEFVRDFLLGLSNEVYNFRKEQPDYLAFREQRNIWNDTLGQLGRSVRMQYDNVVTAAFVEYQEVLENYLFAQGILHTVQGREADPERMEVPGFAEAAARLSAVCEDFAGQLAGETAAQCAAYLKLRRETIDAGRRLCWQCGAELAEALSGQADR